MVPKELELFMSVDDLEFVWSPFNQVVAKSEDLDPGLSLPLWLLAWDMLVS